MTFSPTVVSVMVIMMNWSGQQGVYPRTIADTLGEWELLLQEEKPNQGGFSGRNAEIPHLRAYVLVTGMRAERETGNPFALVEKMLWTPEEGIFLQELHLERLDASAAAFGIRYDPHRLRTYIQKQLHLLEQPTLLTIHLTLRGEMYLFSESYDVAAAVPLIRLVLASFPLDPRQPLLYHSTTDDRLFERYRVSHPHSDAVLLWNQRGEITQTTSGNLVVELYGQLVTPPVESGLLPGTFRAELLNTRKIQERSIRLADVPFCGRAWVIDSIHKWREASII